MQRAYISIPLDTGALKVPVLVENTVSDDNAEGTINIPQDTGTLKIPVLVENTVSDDNAEGTITIRHLKFLYWLKIRSPE